MISKCSQIRSQYANYRWSWQTFPQSWCVPGQVSVSGAGQSDSILIALRSVCVLHLVLTRHFLQTQIFRYKSHVNTRCTFISMLNGVRGICFRSWTNPPYSLSARFAPIELWHKKCVREYWLFISSFRELQVAEKEGCCSAARAVMESNDCLMRSCIMYKFCGLLLLVVVCAYNPATAISYMLFPLHRTSQFCLAKYGLTASWVDVLLHLVFLYLLCLSYLSESLWLVLIVGSLSHLPD